MKIWYNNILDTEGRQVVDVVGSRVRIGRSPTNDIVLNSPYVSGDAAVLYKRQGTWELVTLGIGGVKVGERELSSGERMVIDRDRNIQIWPFTLTLDLPHLQGVNEAAARQALDLEMAQLISEVHRDLVNRMDITISRKQQANNEGYLAKLEYNLDEIAKLKKLFTPQKTNLVDHIAGYCVRSEVLSDVISKQKKKPEQESALLEQNHWSRIISVVPDREQELSDLSRFMMQSLGLESMPDLTQQIEAVETEFWKKWEESSPELHTDFKRYLALRYLKKEIKDIVFGYGPLEDLLRTPTISEIMVVDRDHIYIERSGRVENSGRRFVSDEVTETIIQRIVSKVGRRIDKASPLVDARLTDGSRVNAVIPPIAVSGPCLTVRKFPARKLLIDDLVNYGSLTRTVAEFLRAAVLTRKNILISGGTGTGKTTLLNCLSDFIHDKDRIVTVEDTAELQLKKEHVVRLETKPPNLEGAGEYTIRDLVKNALRMRPDRIVVGECRGAEALDMLQAMNTGHDGSMTTIHANNSADVILRLEVLVQMAADLPILSIHRQVVSAIDLIIQLSRLRDGRRCVTQVTEVIGLDEFEGGIRMRDLFRLPMGDSHEALGSLSPTGSLPTFMEELIGSGMIDLESFYL
ncbi:Pertussis toxin liberation protein H [Planctomycetales bacterium 10988]|nr:Pertussis toxin liberation protein H [Planctomycetales bacterium 10988]